MMSTYIIWPRDTVQSLDCTAILLVKKKTSEFQDISKNTSARKSKKQVELHEFPEQYSKIFRSISSPIPIYSECMVYIFKHCMKTIVSIPELWFGNMYNYALYEPYSKKS